MRFCEITNLTLAFYDSLLNAILRTKIEPPETSLQNDTIFQKIALTS